jgi:hypothetical protein
MFKGFIDLAFELDGRYYVTDYKSNWLGPDIQAYDAMAMEKAILEHRYDLQYVLYLLALHRQLARPPAGLRLRPPCRRRPVHLPARRQQQRPRRVSRQATA